MPDGFDETLTVTADLSGVTRALTDVDRLSQSVGRSLGSALEGAAVRGRSLESVLGTLALRLSDIALKAALKPLETGIGNAVQGLIGSLTGSVTPFANGGVVAAPTYFPMPNGLGLAGEAGTEAILPLAREADGALGVRSSADAAPVSVVVNIATPDAASFRQSEAQVSAALARAVARGRRGL